jgi:hypothetical protein
MTPEGKVKNATHFHLHTCGCIRAGTAENKWPEQPVGWYYMPVKGTPMGVNGIPDIVGFRQVEITQSMVGTTLPVFFSIETKAAGKRAGTTPNQDLRRKEIQAAGGISVVIDNVEQLKEVIDVVPLL